jgi:hypothetical protein
LRRGSTSARDDSGAAGDEFSIPGFDRHEDRTPDDWLCLGLRTM